MGLILDTSILIASERRGEDVKALFYRARAQYGEIELALSTISIIELTHGIYRAKSDTSRTRRATYSEELIRDLPVHPVSLSIAQLAGKIEGEQAARGIAIGFEDLIIGVTALHLGYGVATLNLRHFALIPNLPISSF